MIPKGTAIGVDYSPSAITVAQAAATEAGTQNCEFIAADACDLPFEDETFDIVHCHQTLVHIPNAVRALQEMRRVCKSGGYVAAREGVWSSVCHYPDGSGYLQAWKDAYEKVLRASGAHPEIGHELIRMASESGFDGKSIKTSSSTLNYSEPEERIFWAKAHAGRVRNAEMGGKMMSHAGLTRENVDAIAKAHEDWGAQDDGIFYMVCVEIVCKK